MYHLVMISIKWSETAEKNALASVDVIVTQLLRYHMPLLYFVCNHLISLCDDNDIWSKYDVDGHYFIFAVRIHVNYNNYVLYDIANVITVATLHTAIVFHATV